MVAPAWAEPQFVTLERADRESRIGVQASLQFFEDVDIIGVRTEVYGQIAGALRGGGTFGGYVKLPIGFAFVDEDTGDDNDAGVGDLEIGGYYISRIGARTDLVFHAGLTLPTASDSLGDAALTTVERNYDFVNIFPETTALNLGVTLRTPLGTGAFLQGDLALDLPIDKPGPNSPLFHANLGIGAYVSSIILMGELATMFGDDDDAGAPGFLGSIAFGIRFRGPAHPHVAYIFSFADDSEGPDAHIISAGFYASF